MQGPRRPFRRLLEEVRPAFAARRHHLAVELGRMRLRLRLRPPLLPALLPPATLVRHMLATAM